MDPDRSDLRNPLLGTIPTFADIRDRLRIPRKSAKKLDLTVQDHSPSFASIRCKMGARKVATGKEKKLGLGRYPDVSLKEARRRRDEARALIANGIDPGAQKQAEALQSKLNAATTFRAVGESTWIRPRGKAALL